MLRVSWLKNKEIIYSQEAKSEILKQECKLDLLNTSIGEFQRQTHSNRVEMDDVSHGNEKKHFETLASKICTKWKN